MTLCHMSSMYSESSVGCGRPIVNRGKLPLDGMISALRSATSYDD